ncbi:small subunit rRNA maturation protein TSR4 [Aspergillus lucknowensis]|uniref:Programmed cell death protein 2 n=1 Tax=Aspergillus lucknowensis TaxID=176173 RepID=A0ABR4L8H9_9EURO
MDPYDSDSSGFEDEGDYTETGVVLGYASEEIIEDPITHLGGWPTWLDESTPPPGDFAKCKVCNQPLLLLLEIDAELYEHFPDADRRLYIFSCPRKACNRKPGSIRALRATRNHKSHQPPRKTEEQEPEKKEVEKPSAPKPDLGASLFGSTLVNSVSANPNPFSSKPAATQASNPFAAPIASPTPTPANKPSAKPSTPNPSTLTESFADKVRVSSPPPSSEPTGPPLPWPDQSQFPTPYTKFYIDAERETLSRPPTPKIPENVTIDTEDAEGGPSGTDAKDAFESELDKAFLKFSTRLAHNPEQVLRYEFRGAPILYSHTDPVGKRLHDASRAGAHVATGSSGAGRMPRCESCGSERVFELQLVPHAISILEDGREGVGLGKDDAGMEWGTIIVGVCSRNCGPKEVGVVGWREEWAGVQWEETK